MEVGPHLDLDLSYILRVFEALSSQVNRDVSKKPDFALHVHSSLTLMRRHVFLYFLDNYRLLYDKQRRF